MADYIDREELLEDLERFAPEGRAALLIVRKQKGVEIVKCKNCARAEESIHPRCVWCNEHGRTVLENDFCSYGEEK